MAEPLVCDLCQEPTDPVVFLVTSTDNGDTITLGAGCAPAWALAIVQEIDPGALVAAAKLIAGTAQDGSEAATDPPAATAPKRGTRAAKGADKATAEAAQEGAATTD